MVQLNLSIRKPKNEKQIDQSKAMMSFEISNFKIYASNKRGSHCWKWYLQDKSINIYLYPNLNYTIDNTAIAQIEIGGLNCSKAF